MGRVTKNFQFSVSRTVTVWVRQHALSREREREKNHCVSLPFCFVPKAGCSLISHYTEILSTCYCDSKPMLHSDNVHTGPWESQTPVA